MKIERAGRHELPGSIVLDDQKGDEYFVLVFSKNRFGGKDVHELLTSKYSKLSLGQELSKDDKFSLISETLKVRKIP